MSRTKRRVVQCCEHCQKQDYETRIAELERQVKELEARPRENHFHYYPPVFQQPYVPPTQTQPLIPTWEPWRITCGDPLPLGSTTSVLFTATAGGSN